MQKDIRHRLQVKALMQKVKALISLGTGIARREVLHEQVR
jgi:hypothetical protein